MFVSCLRWFLSSLTISPFTCSWLICRLPIFYFWSCSLASMWQTVIFFSDKGIFYLLFVAYRFYFILLTISTIWCLVSLTDFLLMLLECAFELFSEPVFLSPESLRLVDRRFCLGREWKRGSYSDLGDLYMCKDSARLGNSILFCILSYGPI